MSEPRRPAAPVVWIGAAAVALIAAWLGLTGLPALRTQLVAIHFWVLEAQALLLLVASVHELPRLVAHLRPTASVKQAVAATALLALVLTVFVAPRTNRIYYDEQIYQHVGQSLADLHRAEMCNDGHAENGPLRCTRGEYAKQPFGYPYLLSLGYRAFGVSDVVAPYVNNLAAALLPPVVFLLTVMLFGDAEAGVLAGLVSALIPEHLLWSNTAASEPSAALAAAYAVLAAAWFAKARTTWALVWALAATTFGAQFRPESVLLVPLVLAIVARLAPAELRTRRALAAAFVGVVLSGPLIGHLLVVRGEPWGAPDARMAWVFVPANLAVNGPFYVNNARFPALYALLAVAGVAFAPARRGAVAMVFYFVLFWGVFLFFYAGSYGYGADVRYSLLSHPPLAVCAGVGGSSIGRLLASRWNGVRGRWPLVAGLIVLQFSWFMPQVRAVGDEAWAARADVRFAKEFAAALPPDSFVLAHNPSMFLVWGRNAAQMSFASDEPWVRRHLPARYSGGIYVHWNFWCNVDDPVQTAFCRDVLARYPARLVAERRERTYRYALYRLLLDVSPAHRQ